MTPTSTRGIVRIFGGEPIPTTNPTVTKYTPKGASLVLALHSPSV